MKPARTINLPSAILDLSFTLMVVFILVLTFYLNNVRNEYQTYVKVQLKG